MVTLSVFHLDDRLIRADALRGRTTPETQNSESLVDALSRLASVVLLTSAIAS